MWPAARAYKPDIYDAHMEMVYDASTTVKQYLDTYHNLKWARSTFDPEIKCDYIHNNLAESFNAWIKDFKDLLVDELADTVRQRIMNLFQKRRRIGAQLQGIKKRKRKGRRKVYQNDEVTDEVDAPLVIETPPSTPHEMTEYVNTSPQKVPPKVPKKITPRKKPKKKTLYVLGCCVICKCLDAWLLYVELSTHIQLRWNYFIRETY